MMQSTLTYDKTTLLSLDNPYQQLIEENSLTTNLSGLNDLSAKEQIHIVTQLILSCPVEKIGDLMKKTAKIVQQKPSETSFGQCLQDGLTIYFNLEKACNPENSDPYQFFFESKTYPAQFNRFHKLSVALANRIAITLASQLAHYTPAEMICVLYKHVRMVFLGSDFAAALGQAFLVKDVLNLLNSPTPYKAFLDEEFSPSLLHQFAPLVKKHLTQCDAIAEKLVSTTPLKFLNTVQEQLEELAPKQAFKNKNFQNEPFIQLHASFHQALEQQQSALHQPIIHPSSLFQVSNNNPSDNASVSEEKSTASYSFMR